MSEWISFEEEWPRTNSFVNICYLNEEGEQVIEFVHEKFIDRKPRKCVFWCYDSTENANE